jgi:AcrR family transcriptional regulator
MDKSKQSVKEKREILTAATTLFVAQGFSGTSIEDIASKAKVSVSLVEHHYGDKEKLWHEVKRDSLVDDDFEFSIIENCKDLDSFLEYIVKRRFELYEKRPDIVKMISWQNLEFKTNGKEADGLLGKHPLAPTSWGEFIRVLQFNEKIRDDIDPEFIAHYIANASTAIFYAPTRLSDDPEKRANYLSFVLKSLKNTLEYHAGDYPTLQTGII